MIGIYWRNNLLKMGIICWVFNSFIPAALAEKTKTLDPIVEQRIQSLIERMTTEEKISMLSGVRGSNTSETPAIPRLGIPGLHMTDGPLGINSDLPATAFPAGIALAATFDPTLIGQVSGAIAEEAQFFGKNMLLGPCVNISRTPWGGRNFESYGEDPYLASQLTSAYVKNVMDRQVLTSTKHFILNDQEFNRMTVNIVADLRTIFEIYLPPFEAAINAGTGTIMASFNQVNDVYAAENPFIIQDILKNYLGFQGLVVSDWGGTHSAIASANAGLDIEMPTGDHFGEPLRQAVADGKVSITVINEKVRRILRSMMMVGMLDQPPAIGIGPASIEHQNLAEKAAESGIVLLKNQQNILPLDDSKLKSIAIIGSNAQHLRTGGGSSKVRPFHRVNPLQAIMDRVGSKLQINYAVGAFFKNDDIHLLNSDYVTADFQGIKTHGLRGEYFINMNLEGEPTVTQMDSTVNFELERGNFPKTMPKEHFSARWTGTLQVPHSGHYRIVTNSDDGVRVYINNQLAIDHWTDHGPRIDETQVELLDSKTYELRIEYYQNVGGAIIQLGMFADDEDLQMAVNAAAKSDVAVIFTGLGEDFESEGDDRTSLHLPPEQIKLIQEVVAVNPRTIVVFNSGSALLVDNSLDRVPGLLQFWYPGQEGGTAIARVLFGDVSPSGKLPITWMKREEDTSSFHSYPGVNDKTFYSDAIHSYLGFNNKIFYSEGVLVGYRHFDYNRITPLFPFGYGLTYSNFKLSDLQIKTQSLTTENPDIMVKATLTNLGSRTASEVVQLYVGESNPTVVRPPQELKGFSKVTLAPGKSRQVIFHLDKRSFAYFDATQRRWIVNPGKFKLNVGFSSRDTQLSEWITIVE
jgi:beta-glucosidase